VRKKARLFCAGKALVENFVEIAKSAGSPAKVPDEVYLRQALAISSATSGAPV
jgi:hypothetical protein